MSDSKPNPILRLFPSLTDVAFLMPIVFLYLRMGGATSMLGDGDTGWHIRTGEWILDHGRVPQQDLFSFTKAGEPWFAWEWLWDVLFGWMHRHFGMAAVVLASAFLISLTFVLVFRLVRRKCGSGMVAIAFTLLAAAGSSIHWLARPHIFTLFFVAIFLTVLERAKDGKLRLLLALPLLTVLWTNLHGGFFVGCILIFTYAAGEIAGALIEAEDGRRTACLRMAKYFSLAGASCVLASLVNPYTYQLHLHIASYLTRDFERRNISEFLSISFQNPAAIYFETMILFGLAGAFLGLVRRRFTYSLLVLSWLHLALIAARNIPIFMIVAAPVAGQLFTEMLAAMGSAPVAAWVRRLGRGAQDWLSDFDGMDRIGRVHLVSASVALFVLAISYAPAPPKVFRAAYDADKYPAKALTLFRSPGFSGRIFTADVWGGYLIYEMYPAIKVFIDGRSDFYGPRFAERYIDVMNVKYDWEQALDRYRVDTVLLSPDAPLAGAMKESRRWRAVYDDGVAIVFQHAAGAQPQTSVVKNNGTGRDVKVTTSETPTLEKTSTRRGRS